MEALSVISEISEDAPREENGVLQAVFDESGKFHSSDRVCIGGYVSDNARWKNFGADWKRFLARRHIASLHTSDLMSRRQPDYQGVTFSESDKLEILKEGMAIANSSVLACFGIAVDCASFKAMSKAAQKQCYGDAHLFCFGRLVKAVVGMLEKLNPITDREIHHIHTVFDDNREYAVRCYELLDGVKERNPSWKARLSGICFVDDDKFPPLQAADLFSWVSTQKMIVLSGKQARFDIAILDELLDIATTGRRVIDEWYIDESMKEVERKLLGDLN